MAQNHHYFWWWHASLSQSRFPGNASPRSLHITSTEVGYNYRLSNVLAGLGRGQLRVLERRVAARRRNFEVYQQALGNLPGIEFMPEASFDATAG